MTILEEYVWINLHSKTTIHFENLGYNLPKYADAQNILRVKRGTKILVKVEDLPKGSGVKVTKVCDDCGIHSLNQPYSAIIKSRNDGDGKDRCFDCGTIKGGYTQKSNLAYENSLEHFSKINDKEYLIKEFSAKNNKKPCEIAYGSNFKFWWNCQKCESEYEMTVNERTYLKYNCPYCSGKRVNHTNSLGSKKPELVKEWHPFKNRDLTPFNIIKSSNEKVWWKCSECKHEWKAQVNSRTYGKGCPMCSKSKGEKRIKKYLENLSIPFIPQKEFDGLMGLGGGNLSYDFYLPEQNLLIEYQGQFHDGSNGIHTMSNLNKQKEHDRRKSEYASNNNYRFIEIWYKDFNKIELILEKEIS